jgi:hypothetical protein
VNKRGVTWLLAVLMALCASQAVPVVRSERAGSTCGVVWIARARARAEERVAAQRLAGVAIRAAAGQLVDPQFRSRLLAHSLDQRPPPSPLC